MGRSPAFADGPASCLVRYVAQYAKRLTRITRSTQQLVCWVLVIPLHRYACKERVHRISHGSFCFRLVSLVRSKEVRLLLLKCPRRKKTLTEDEMWEMEDKLAALNKELEESLQRS